MCMRPICVIRKAKESSRYPFTLLSSKQKFNRNDFEVACPDFPSIPLSAFSIRGVIGNVFQFNIQETHISYNYFLDNNNTPSQFQISIKGKVVNLRRLFCVGGEGVRSVVVHIHFVSLLGLLPFYESWWDLIDLSVRCRITVKHYWSEEYKQGWT